jgi:hypothetical protein
VRCSRRGLLENKVETESTPETSSLESDVGQSSLPQATRAIDLPHLHVTGKKYDLLPQPGSRATYCCGARWKVFKADASTDMAKQTVL